MPLRDTLENAAWDGPAAACWEKPVGREPGAAHGPRGACGTGRACARAVTAPGGGEPSAQLNGPAAAEGARCSRTGRPAPAALSLGPHVAAARAGAAGIAGPRV